MTVNSAVFAVVLGVGQAVRVEAIRADRAAMEFRGLPPAAHDQLVRELGSRPC